MVNVELEENKDLLDHRVPLDEMERMVLLVLVVEVAPKVNRDHRECKVLLDQLV